MTLIEPDEWDRVATIAATKMSPTTIKALLEPLMLRYEREVRDLHSQHEGAVEAERTVLHMIIEANQGDPERDLPTLAQWAEARLRELGPSGASRAQEADAGERRAYLVGRYDALRLLSTSPRMNRPQLELIQGLARDLMPELRALGVEFQEVRDAA